MANQALLRLDNVAGESRLRHGDHTVMMIRPMETS